MSIEDSVILSDIFEKYPRWKYLTSQVDWNNLTHKATDYLRWATNHRSVTISKSDIPIGVLPNGRQGFVHDIKIKSSRGPDDAIYDQHEDLRKKCARGNTVLEIIDGPQNGRCVVIHALKKFTSSDPYDDDDRADNLVSSSKKGATCVALVPDAWTLYFTKPADDTKKIICTEKANGEAAHLACVKIEGVFVLICGSKNVHMALRNKDQIDSYKGDMYRVSREISKSIFDTLDDLPSEKREALLEFLVVTRFTAVFEILCPNHQHVENLSFLTKNKLVFIAWTSTEVGTDDLVAIPPHEGIEIARIFGLHTIWYNEITPDDLESYILKLRHDKGYEGQVLYYIDKDDKTIGLIKKKTCWYILCRAIREKTKGACYAKRRNASSFQMKSWQQRVSSRMYQIQQWLNLPDEVVERWISLGSSFIHFVIDQSDFSVDEVANMFPLVWAKFLTVKSLTDDVFPPETEKSIDATPVDN